LLQTVLEEKKTFYLGIMIGFLVSCFCLTAMLYLLVSRGVTIELNAEELAKTISLEVKEQMKNKVPDLIDEAKSKLPKEMAQQATQEFAKTNIEFLNVKFHLPENALAGIEGQLETTFAKSLNKSLQNLNPESLVQKLEKTSYEMTKKTLQEKFNKKTFSVKAYGIIKIPVTLQIN